MDSERSGPGYPRFFADRIQSSFSRRSGVEASHASAYTRAIAFFSYIWFKQGWQSHCIDDILRYLLRRKTAMRFCDAK